MKKNRILFLLIMLSFVFLLTGCDFLDGDTDEGKLPGENEVKILTNESSLTGDPFEEVVSTLEGWGFTNVKSVPVYDIVWGFTKPGTTKSVTINGSKNFKKGDIFDKDVAIIVTYSMPVDDDPKNQNHTITWKNDDGEIIDTQVYKYGVTPVFVGADPVKEGSREISYIFSGWSPTIESVTKNQTYIATYTEYENEEFSLFFESTSRGQITGEGLYYEKERVVVKAESDEYFFQGWYINDELVSKSQTYSFIMPSSNITLRARFSAVNELEVGDTYYFGSYPQSRVLDSNLLSELSDTIELYPTPNNFNGWKSFEYYSGSNKSHYSWYKDIVHEDTKYRAIYFDKYRPRSTTSTSHQQSSSLQYANGYLINEIYWFSFDQIEWKVLFNDGESLKLIVKDLLDAQQFYRTTVSHNGDEWGYFSANFYKGSDIRYWLNNTFYETAFNSLEQTKIMTTLIDNTHGVFNSQIYDTEDKVHLLSYYEAGLENFASITSVEDADRRLKGTDYALSQGLSVSSNGFSYWWLRTPRDSTFGVYTINQNGRTAITGDNTPVNQSHYGVAPVIIIKY